MSRVKCLLAPRTRVAGLALIVLGLLGTGTIALGQQRIGYIDTEYIFNNLPEYGTVQQKLEQLEKQWQNEIQKRREAVQEMEDQFQARELLYTEEERQQRRQEIQKARKKVEQLRQRYFGPEGALYSQQQELMRPIQERILKATEAVATASGYDYVLDKGGEVLFMYARDEHNLSDRVLRELGVNVDQQAQTEQQ